MIANIIHLCTGFINCFVRQKHNWRLILLFFDALSGMSIDMEKSARLPFENVADPVCLAHEQGCKVVSFSSTYLGLC